MGLWASAITGEISLDKITLCCSAAVWNCSVLECDLEHGADL